MNGEMVSFECMGESYDAYFSKSVTGSGPGVVVLQEYWGLVGHIKNVTDRFAVAGFNAVAPDLFKGKTTEEPEEAGKLLMALNISETEKILRCVVDLVLADPTTTSEKAGVVGFCMGGQLSLFAAATNKRIGAAVDYYGIHPNVLPPFELLEAPVLGFFAERDNYAPPEVVQSLDQRLTELGKPHEFKTYPNTDHAFFNDARPEVYNEAAAQDSWDRMLQFFRENLLS